MTGQVWIAEWVDWPSEIFLVLGYDLYPGDLKLFNLESGEFDTIPASILIKGRSPWWRRIT